MASTEWRTIYTSYSAEELEAEIVALKKEATLYTAQNEGDKGYQKDLSAVRDRLEAAVYVRAQRRQAGRGVVMTPDFSGW